MKNTKATIEKISHLRAKLKSRNYGKLRLSVYRSNQGITAQIIDDLKGTTLVQKNSNTVKNPGKTKTEASAAVGKAIAEEALTKKISEVYFDRRSYRFHGRVKALADAARAAGLKF